MAICINKTHFTNSNQLETSLATKFETNNAHLIRTKFII